MRMWKRNGNTTTLLFSLKLLEILHQERRGQVNTIMMEHFNISLFYKSGPTNKQHTYQLINHIVDQKIARDRTWAQGSNCAFTPKRPNIFQVF